MPATSLVLAALLLQTPSVAGTRYTFRMITDDDSTVGTVREDGRRARIDIERERDGEYILVQNGGRRVIAVHPRDGDYAVTDDSTFSQVAAIGLRAASSTGVVRFRVREMRFSSRRLGAGEVIAGKPTERFRLIQEFTVGVSAFGMAGETVRQVVVTDYWVTRSVTLVPNPLIDLVSTIASVLGQSDPEFVRRSNEERQALFRGVPLRIVVTSHTLDEPDKLTTQSIEILGLEAARLDPSLWDVPAGLHRREGDFSWHF